MIQAIKNWEELGHTPLSYSSIKSFREGGISRYWAHKEGMLPDKSTASLTLGTLIDEYLLNREKFFDKYLIQTTESPSSENQKKFAQEVASEMFSMEEAYKRNYKNAPKTASKLTEKANELYEDLKDWITFIPEIQGKELYSESDSFALSQISMNLMGNKAFRDIYGVLQGDTQLDGVDVRTHVNLKGDLYGFPARGELDLLTIDHNEKSIQIYDVKSTHSNLKNFHYEARSYKYPLQHIIYYNLAKSMPEYKDLGYLLKIPKFVVCKTGGSFNTGVYQLPEEWIVQEVRAVKEDIKTLAWHYENKKFKYPKEYYEGDGILTMQFLEDMDLWKANVEQQLS